MTRSREEIEPAILRRGHERPRERLVETARQQILANQIIPISKRDDFDDSIQALGSRQQIAPSRFT